MNFLKYLLEGIVVSIVSYVKSQNSFMEIVLIGLTASVSFMILDMFAPEIYHSAKQGTGFGMGLKLTPFVGGSNGRNRNRNRNGGGNKQDCRADGDDGFFNQGMPLKEHFESELQLEAVEKENSKPYKLHNGNYATTIVLPGYNEEITGYNQSRIDNLSVV